MTKYAPKMTTILPKFLALLWASPVPPIPLAYLAYLHHNIQDSMAVALCYKIKDDYQRRDVLEEESHGYEVAAARLPDAAAVPEEAEEEQVTNNRNRSSTKRLVVTLTSAAGFGLFIAGVWSVVSPASSKTINVRSKQVVVAAGAPIDNYVQLGEFGSGTCVDMEGEQYPSVAAGKIAGETTTIIDCADKCECARGIKGVTLRGFTFTFDRLCSCLVDRLDSDNAKDQKKIEDLESACNSPYGDGSGTLLGTGEISGPCCGDTTFCGGCGDVTIGCYKLKTTSKAGKAPKAP